MSQVNVFIIHLYNKYYSNLINRMQSNRKVKLLIFRSEVTKAVYAWNGDQVITIVGVRLRPVGHIMHGIPGRALRMAYRRGAKTFKVGDATYTVLNDELSIIGKLSELKRYNTITASGFEGSGDAWTELDEDDNGELVKWEDIKQILDSCLPAEK